MEKVRAIFAETLDERYAGELKFDPIIVKPDVGYYGDDYVRVLLVVNGDTGFAGCGVGRHVNQAGATKNDTRGYRGIPPRPALYPNPNTSTI